MHQKYKTFLLFTVAWLTLDQLVVRAVTELYPAAVNTYEELFVPSVPVWSRVAVSAFLLAALLFLIRKQRISVPVLPMSLVSGGLASNALSLWLYGKYVDYIPLRIFVTNVADCMVTVGLLSLGYLLYKRV